MSDSNLIKLKKETYLKMIENSIGTKLFNSAFVKNKETGKVFDILNDGEFSCAFYVSGVLSLLGLIDKPHSTVKTMVEKLEKDENWQKVRDKDLLPGDVVVWKKIAFEDGTEADHIGFILNKNKAISTNYFEKKVVSHHPTFGTNKNGSPKRKIIKVFRHSELSQN